MNDEKQPTHSILVLILVAPLAWGRITLLPSDDTAGGGAGDTYSSMIFGAEPAAWANLVVGHCLKVSSIGTPGQCDTSSFIDNKYQRAYAGTPTVRSIACTPIGDSDPESWTSADSYYDVAVYSVKGIGVEYNRVKLGVALRVRGGVGVNPGAETIVQAINTQVADADGMLQVAYSAVNDGGGEAGDADVTCTVYLTGDG